MLVAEEGLAVTEKDIFLERREATIIFLLF